MSDNNFIPVENPISIDINEINKATTIISNQQHQNVLNSTINMPVIENHAKITNELIE